MEIAIIGEGEVVIRFIDRHGHTLLQERLVVSGPPGVQALRHVSLAIGTVRGPAELAPVVASLSNPQPRASRAADARRSAAVRPSRATRHAAGRRPRRLAAPASRASASRRWRACCGPRRTPLAAVADREAEAAFDVMCTFPSATVVEMLGRRCAEVAEGAGIGN